MAVRNGEAPDAIESSRTDALLWLDRARQSAGGSRTSALRVIVPKSTSAVLAYRLGALDARVTIQIYELDALSGTLERVNPYAEGNVPTWWVPYREPQLLLERAREAFGADHCVSAA
jgi:hypothetical protein